MNYGLAKGKKKFENKQLHDLHELRLSNMKPAVNILNPIKFGHVQKKRKKEQILEGIYLFINLK